MAENDGMNGSRLSPEWRPDANLLAWSKGRRPDLDIEDTIEQFRDHWVAKPGKDAAKLDWDATWRNWVRRAYSPGFRNFVRATTPKPASHTPAKPASHSLTDAQCAENLDKLSRLMGNLFRSTT